MHIRTLAYLCIQICQYANMHLLRIRTCTFAPRLCLTFYAVHSVLQIGCFMRALSIASCQTVHAWLHQLAHRRLRKCVGYAARALTLRGGDSLTNQLCVTYGLHNHTDLTPAVLFSSVPEIAKLCCDTVKFEMLFEHVHRVS